MLDDARYLEVIAAESAAFADAATDLSSEVPTCPEWNVGELVVHLGSVFAGVEEVVRTKASEPGEGYDEEPAEEQDAVEWFRAKSSALIDTLGSAPPDLEVWTWWHERSVRFWLRRMAHEVTIHRWDMQNATGVDLSPIDHDVALDGIDEMLSVHLFDGAPAPWADGSTLAFVVPSADRAWRVAMGPKLVEMTRTSGPADVEVSGGPQEVLLLLWGRALLDRVQVAGDESAVQAFLDL